MPVFRSLTGAPMRANVPSLAWTLVRTDFKVRYHGTIAGFLWALLKPLAMVLVLVGVFSFVFGAQKDYASNVIIGILLYDFFSEATKVGLTSLRSKGYLLTKSAAPSWIIVATSVSNAAITLGVVASVYLAVISFRGQVLTATGLALLLWYLCHYVLMVVGISLATSVLFLKYRDLHEVWDVLIQAGFFVAPIVYPLSILPEKFHIFLYAWPPTPIIQFVRAVLLTGQVPTFRAHVYLSIETLAIVLLGTWVFGQFRGRVAEYL
jgi:lipopolysaccharide transport system permease protein